MIKKTQCILGTIRETPRLNVINLCVMSTEQTQLLLKNLYCLLHPEFSKVGGFALSA